MIEFIKGRVVSCDSEELILEINNIGIKIIATKDLVKSCQIGNEVVLVTYLHLREDIIQLYAFSSKLQKDCFCLLLKVGGIGPRTAISILSTLSLHSFQSAVINNQVEVLSAVPGVGKKTASKIVLFLQDRFPINGDLLTFDSPNNIDYEVLQALSSLGYSILESQAAVQSIAKDVPQELEARVQAALRYFSK